MRCYRPGQKEALGFFEMRHQMVGGALVFGVLFCLFPAFIFRLTEILDSFHGDLER